MNRRRRKGGGDPPPEEPIHLRIPVEEARRLLDQQIAKGDELLKSLTDKLNPTEFTTEARGWHDYNRDLISRRLFGSERAITETYNTASIGPLLIDPDAWEVADAWARDIHSRIQLLKSLRGRLELLAEGAAAGAVAAHSVPGTAVFLIHGHDLGALDTVARYLESLGLDVRILKERPTGGAYTVIEKLEKQSEGVGYAAALRWRNHRPHTQSLGTYPLPDPAQYETFITIINLGDDESVVLSQVYWTGGTYSHGPVRIPAKGSVRLDLDELVRSEKPAILRRLLSPEYPQGVFKWLVQSAAGELLGRADIVPRGSGESFGFNCFGCCYQIPTGAVEPFEVEFYPGESPLFEACVYYDTCSGPMGPFPGSVTSMSTPSPFSWDSVNLQASDAGYELLSFDGSEWRITASCQEGSWPTHGFGRGDSCRIHILGYSTTQTCSQQTAFCTSCFGCCQSFYNYNICRKVSPSIAQSEKHACEGVCINDKRC